MKAKPTQTYGARSASFFSSFISTRSISIILFFLAFCLPNLVFSGSFFFDTLHIMKWATTFAPLALMGFFAGFRAARFGTQRARFRIDGFAWVWLILLLYLTAQPLWLSPRSMETFYKELFFFASLWLVYVLTGSFVDGKLLRILLWGSLFNAAINVVFAEIQLLGISASYPFIFPISGVYVGNTGQQNMFALWLAICGVNGTFLLLSTTHRSNTINRALLFLLSCLLFTIFLGLITSTSRSGIMAFSVGFVSISFFFLRIEGKRRLPKILFIICLFLTVAGVAISKTPTTGALLTEKIEDIATKPLSLAKRDVIWATSWTMFSQHPFKGVGLGQYKWNYIDATNATLRRWPQFQWQYTHWAHNEFLQWMAETGAIGATLMFFLWLWWIFSAFHAFLKGDSISPESVWGTGIIALFFFNALWTRPFHRIENVIWLALAFAIANKEIIYPRVSLDSFGFFRKFTRIVAGVVCLISLSGLIYLSDGIRGDRLLRLAADGAGGDMTAVKELYRKAYNSPMVKETAKKQLGYFSVQLGEATGNADMIADGLNVLIEYFEKQPHVDELRFFYTWAKRMGDNGFIEYIRKFMPFLSMDKEQN